ncbi:MAG: MerR family transcriptional regulator [Myxococcota bacterium]
MEYRVAALAEAAGVGVDTVRFYQARGLIPPPARRGRFAIYSTEHLERIRRIRSLLDAGFSLAQIRRLLDTEPEAVAAPAAGVGRSRRRGASADRTEETTLLAALAAQRVGEGTLGRAELAAASGIPEALVAAAVQAGLIAPIEIHGEERFPRSDLELLQAALELLGLGLPLDRLLELAAQHAAQVDHLADQAIELFDDHVRKPQRRGRGSPCAALRAVASARDPDRRAPLPRTGRRLRPRTAADRGEARALEKALEATQAARLEVQWR